MPVTTILYALGLDQEGICKSYYDTVDFRYLKDSWSTKFFPERSRGTKPAFDLIDAETGEVIAEQGKKITPRQVKKFIDGGKQINIKVPMDFIAGRFCSQDIIDEKTGRIWIEAGEELTIDVDVNTGEMVGGNVKTLIDEGLEFIPTLDIDNINVGPYIRNTMVNDKSYNKETALSEIYRVMRPGEPPTLESAMDLLSLIHI